MIKKPTRFPLASFARPAAPLLLAFALAPRSLLVVFVSLLSPMSASNPCSLATATPLKQAPSYDTQDRRPIQPRQNPQGGNQTQPPCLAALGASTALKHAVPPGSARPARRRRPGTRPLCSRPCGRWYVDQCNGRGWGGFTHKIPKAFPPVWQNKLCRACPPS